MKRDLIAVAHRAVRSLRMSDRARGDAARDARNWLAAIPAYQAHLAANAEDTAIWIQLGHAFKEAGALDDARDAYLRALTLDPDDADLLLNCAHLYKIRGEMHKAVDAYAASAALEPELFGGAAMIAREQILGRLTWHGADGATPGTISGLLAAIEDGERAGKRIFGNYYDSFEAR